MEVHHGAVEAHHGAVKAHHGTAKVHKGAVNGVFAGFHLIRNRNRIQVKSGIRNTDR
jgi:hypothetical protein